jgi:hypothetical protein
VSLEGILRTELSLTADMDWTYSFPSKVLLDKTVYGAQANSPRRPAKHSRCRIWCHVDAGWDITLLGFTLQGGIYIKASFGCARRRAWQGR